MKCFITVGYLILKVHPWSTITDDKGLPGALIMQQVVNKNISSFTTCHANLFDTLASSHLSCCLNCHVNSFIYVKNSAAISL